MQQYKGFFIDIIESPDDRGFYYEITDEGETIDVGEIRASYREAFKDAKFRIDSILWTERER